MSSGGKREGAGRKSMVSNKKAINITLSAETKELVERYANDLGLSRSDFIDRFLYLYVDQCQEILRCPHCGSPIMWYPVQCTEGGTAVVTCKECGKDAEFKI